MGVELTDLKSLLALFHKKMANEILTNFVGLVSQLPDLEEFPEESRENFNKVGIQSRVDIDLVQIFEQYFLATIDEVDRFKKINDPLVIHAEDSENEDCSKDKEDEFPSMVNNPDTDGSGQGSSKQADIADAAAAAEKETKKKKKKKKKKNPGPKKKKKKKKS